ncbi:MAG: hypothetical protein GF409_06180 [Candidatus Omnitrophica bacterium]|nr:hypothetical protein [Candidatus Omnitrophota bacterium]
MPYNTKRKGKNNMKTVTRIDDINDPRVLPYRSLKMRHPDKDGLFVVESKPAVKALLESGMDIVSCLTTPRIYRELEMPDKRNIRFYLMEKKAIEDVIGFRFHHGVMMAARLPKRRDLEKIPVDFSRPHLVVALNGVHDPQNVGMIIRNAAAFGADALVVDAGTYEPFYRKVSRISMGSVFKIPVAYEEDLAPALGTLRQKYGTKIVVSSLSPGAVSLEEADLSDRLCLVLGNEFSGASEKLAETADLSVRIPHEFGKVDSLNVSCAAAVCLYQASLKRSLHKKSGPGDYTGTARFS